MKKSLVKKITLSILTGAILLSSNVVWAAEDIKNGDDVIWGYFSYDGGFYLREPSNNLDGVVPDRAYNENFYGAYGFNSADATGGKVTINGGTFGIANSPVSICGGFSNDGNATDNAVTISGGSVTGDVFGGYSGYGGASNNTVTISGNANLENANLYGGAKWEQAYGFAGFVGDYGGAGTPNTLKINQWVATDNGASNGTKVQNKVKSIQGFDKIHFEDIDWNLEVPVVEVTESLILNNTEIKVGTVNVAGGTKLNNGDAMTLISVTGNGGISGDISNDETVVCEGVANVYKGYVKQLRNSIFLGLGDGPEGEYTVPDDDSQGGGDNTGGDNTGDNTGGDNTGGDNTGGDNTGGDNTGGDNTGGDNTGGDNTGGDNTGGDNTGGDNTGGDNTGGDNTGGDNTGEGTLQPSRNNQVLVLGESRAAAVAFTNQGSELIELGLNALARDNSKDTKVFAAVYGNHSEYETGSHVNVNGWSGIVGIGKTNANGLTVGAFFENGEGNYSTHNDYNAQYIRGDGEACYNGGGLLVRKDNANGVYAEASLRAGNLQNELRNAVRNGANLTGYDVDTFYYGAHIGIGKVIARGADGDSLDVYGKFIYTHHDGETFDVGGTPTKFDSVESERLRLGFRLNEVQTNKLSMYYGAAWEYEFNGDAHDKIASFDLETPSLEGSTVIGEIGMYYKASEKWSIDLNGRAYVGQREGFSGSVQANYSF